jgi:hypothetical protein
LVFQDPLSGSFNIPQQNSCDLQTVDTLAPGTFTDVVRDWKFDKCTEFGQGKCLKSERLPEGKYSVSGALWSSDKTTYAEFSFGITAPPLPSLPKTGDRPAGTAAGDSLLMAIAGLALGTLGLAVVRAICQQNKAATH